MQPWERYASLVDDPDAFRSACRHPLPTVVRVNPIKSTPERAIRALERDGIAVTRRAWSPNILELDTDTPGRTWPYQHGFIHGQEELSQLPPRILEPGGDDVVWDAAAAPGGKATQLAAMVRSGGGILVANDVNLGRLAALRSNADRLGVDNAVVTRQDARRYSMGALDTDAFDRALVDAPCSGEGTIRKNPRVTEEWNEDTLPEIAVVQRGLLKRAVELTRPGGVVVYATCTFAPEENEGVLDSIVRDLDCAIEPYDVPLEHSEGVRSWGERTYHPSVGHVKRFFPHQNDTGGFTCAKLRVGG